AAFSTLSVSSVTENGSVTVSGSFTDAGLGDAHTAVIDWGNGDALTRISLTAGTNTFATSHQYLDDTPSGTSADNYTVRVRVLDDAADLLVLDTTTSNLLRYDGGTGTSAGTFLSRSVSGVTGARGLAVGPDGNLYVAFGSNASVRRYGGKTGADLGAFVAPGAGGLSSPGDVAFGPDGDLYVYDYALRTVLRFDGPTGSVVGAVGSAGPASFHQLWGADGNLYLADGGTSYVTRVSGTPGEDLGRLVGPGAGGLGAAGYLAGLSPPDEATVG